MGSNLFFTTGVFGGNSMRVSETVAELDDVLDSKVDYVTVRRNVDGAEHRINKAAVTGYRDDTIQ